MIAIVIIESISPWSSETVAFSTFIPIYRRHHLEQSHFAQNSYSNS